MTTPNPAPHTANVTPEGTGYLVTCPHGCNLGTSAHAADQTAADRRVRLHRTATTTLAARQVSAPAADRCATVGHITRPATHEISYRYRGEDEVTCERVCAECADSYGCRPVLVGFTAAPLGTGEDA